MNSQLKTMRVGIAIDDWKLPVFKRRLTEADFTFEQRVGVTPDTLMLYVETKEFNRLGCVIEDAAAECARRKLQ